MGNCPRGNQSHVICCCEPIPLSSDEAYRAIDRLRGRQRDVLGAIAMDQPGVRHPRTLAKLLSLGLITEHEETQQWEIGTFRFKRYATPLPVHIAWCRWCADHFADEPSDDFMDKKVGE